jgi:tripartite-type tricarboxylate transporter receptor subunit TctC
MMQAPIHVLRLAAALLVAGVACVHAQEQYPNHPIKVLVPFAPGGAVDIVARIVTEQMRQSLGQSLVIENKPGAVGVVAIEQMMRAKADGYTLMFGNNNTNVITPILYAKKLTIDYDRDVIPIARLADVPGFFTSTTKNFSPASFAEFLAYARANPGKLRYGSVGVGSFPQFDMEILSRRAGISLVHIPNKSGAAGMLNDLVAGDTQVGFLNMATSAPMMRAGQLRALAIVTEERSPDHPDVPTMTEAGFPGVGTLQLLGLFAPSGVPPAIIAKLYQASVEAVRTPAVIERLKAQSMRAVPSASPQEARAWLAEQMALWRRITEEVKIELPE